MWIVRNSYMDNLDIRVFKSAAAAEKALFSSLNYTYGKGKWSGYKTTNLIGTPVTTYTVNIYDTNGSNVMDREVTILKAR